MSGCMVVATVAQSGAPNAHGKLFLVLAMQVSCTWLQCMDHQGSTTRPCAEVCMQQA